MMATAYATRAEMYQLGIPSAALASVATADQDAALEAASRRVDMYLARGGGVLTTWDSAITRHVCVMAAYDLLIVRGVDPSAGTDMLVARYQQTLTELNQIAKLQLASPATLVSDANNAPIGWVADSRGWDPGDGIP